MIIEIQLGLISHFHLKVTHTQKPSGASALETFPHLPLLSPQQKLPLSAFFHAGGWEGEGFSRLEFPPHTPRSCLTGSVMLQLLV